jgi:hypothetical protein
MVTPKGRNYTDCPFRPFYLKKKKKKEKRKKENKVGVNLVISNILHNLEENFVYLHNAVITAFALCIHVIIIVIKCRYYPLCI